MASTLLSTSELIQRLNRTTIISSQKMGWNGILVEQHQFSPPEKTEEKELPALSDHWLILPLGGLSYLSQQSDYRLHESIFQQGDSLLVPAGQASSWHCLGSETCQILLNVHLQPRLVKQVAKAAEVDTERLDLVKHFAKQDLQLQRIAMLLLAELRSDSMMGKLYVESLSQALVIHLLRHYSETVQTITPENRSLTYRQVQQAIDYIHTHLDQNLSLTELASVINISPTYFASLFKQAIGTSPHQYVIQQRVERAKMMLKRTDLAIADIAMQVGFSSQSHLTQHFKRLTGLTPKQIR